MPTAWNDQEKSNAGFLGRSWNNTQCRACGHRESARSVAGQLRHTAVCTQAGGRTRSEASRWLTALGLELPSTEVRRSARIRENLRKAVDLEAYETKVSNIMKQMEDCIKDSTILGDEVIADSFGDCLRDIKASRKVDDGDDDDEDDSSVGSAPSIMEPWHELMRQDYIRTVKAYMSND